MQLREAASTIIDRNESLPRCGQSCEVTNKGANESLTNRSNVREELSKSCYLRRVVGETIRPFVLILIMVNKVRSIHVRVCACIYIYLYIYNNVLRRNFLFSFNPYDNAFIYVVVRDEIVLFSQAYKVKFLFYFLYGIPR